MPELSHTTIDASRPAYVRAGIKWDALERDDIEELYEFGSLKEARRQFRQVVRWLRFFKFMARFLRVTLLVADMAENFDHRIEKAMEKKKALDKYFAQAKLRSYDLDLCCFCYDKNGAFVGAVAPAYEEAHENLKQDNLAFMHSGDDVTGTGEAFDEEMLVNLHAIDAGIHQVFFVVISVNHGFDKIKGGSWTLIRTKDEAELMHVPLVTKDQNRAHVMAKMTREGTGWVIDEIAEYGPVSRDEKIPMRQRVDALLSSRYVAAPSAPESASAPSGETQA